MSNKWNTQFLPEFHADFKSAHRLKFSRGCLVFCKISAFQKRVKKTIFLMGGINGNYFFIKYNKNTILSLHALIYRIADMKKMNLNFCLFKKSFELLLYPVRTRSKVPAVGSRVYQKSKIKIRIIEALSYQSGE
jgi:hypothetical protein